uniref:Clc-like protein 2 n=1 Tax=Parascaris univalens TaxID=6257 RepID=A0A915BB30_PARUN
MMCSSADSVDITADIGELRFVSMSLILLLYQDHGASLQTTTSVSFVLLHISIGRRLLVPALCQCFGSLIPQLREIEKLENQA